MSLPRTTDIKNQDAALRTRAVVRKALGLGWTYFWLILLLVFAVFPFVWTLAISITDKGVTGGTSIYDFPASLLPKQITFDNFVQVFNTFNLGKYLWNSVVISFWTVLGTLVISALAAYPLARLEFPFKNIIFAAVVSTLVLPSETNFIVNVLLLRDLQLLGTYAGVVVPTIAGAFGIFVMRQAYMAIPSTLMEAARIDGASELQILWRVMVPLSVPSLTALGIFTLVGTWNAYFWPSLALITNQDLHPLAVAVLTLKGQFNYDPFNIAAGAMIMMLPVLIVFLLAQRLFMRGLDGAVKG